MASMTDFEVRKLALRFGALIICAFLVSLHVYLCAHGWAHYRRSAKAIQKNHKTYVWAMFVILVLSTATFGLEVAFLYTSLSQTQGRTSPQVLLRLTNVLQTFLGLTHAAAAGILVWRCYLIWTGRRWIGLIPLLPFVATLALGIKAIVVQTQCRREVLIGFPDACNEEDLFLHHSLYFVAATIVNVVSTTLICIRLLHMKHRILNMDQSTDRFGRGASYNRITMILVESALPSTAVGVSCGIFSLVNRSGYWYFARRLWTPATALGAQFIFYRVTSGASWTSSPGSGELTLPFPVAFIMALKEYL
ncbi:hypothetical protein BKA70DRAFT_1521390 [Coprinopsis sp. MPI-PUGE-AT-0042]|nr:hypothetical protein BKA70DRAFT_1521390 [Coprinopsis sp. MPI-PUGE-AT-0042]